MYLPLVFKGAGMHCLIVGGGEVALRKVELLSAADCAVTVVAPHIHDGIQSAIETKGVRWIAREFRSGDCSGYQLVIAATERREVNRAVFDEAKSLCIPVNVVDDPELCTVIFPAVWQKDPLMISVGTGGGAPFMAAAVRDRVAAQGASLARWTEIAAEFRTVVRSEISDWNEKNLLYRKFTDTIRQGDPPDPPESRKLSDWMAWLEKLRGETE
jgi:uroporphyrin-III C-methyltransferase/precorrin-2 dehydrogenase/sirohydrochlorin ferrochelatase